MIQMGETPPLAAAWGHLRGRLRLMLVMFVMPVMFFDALLC